MSHCSILETKVGNDKLWNPGFVYENKGTIVIKQIGYEKQKSN